MKSKNNKNNIRKKSNKNSQQTIAKHLYELDEVIIYKGNLYEKYHNQLAKITRCKTEKKFYKWYDIEFEDGYSMTVKEGWIDKNKIEEEDGGL